MHDPQRTLQSLIALRYERTDYSPFKTHTEFLQWADKAGPLLQFNGELAQQFLGSVHAATAVRTWKPEKYISAINNAIGSVNQAITQLEHQTTEVATSAEANAVIDGSPLGGHAPPPPDKLTLKWLYEHAPWSFYVRLFGVVAVAFGLGFSASESLTTMKSANLSVAAPTTTKPTSVSAPIRPASTP